MVVQLIASALLLDFFGCMMPLALVEDTKAFKVGVFLIWAALVADSVLMGLFYPRELAGGNPLFSNRYASSVPCIPCMGSHRTWPPVASGSILPRPSPS